MLLVIRDTIYEDYSLYVYRNVTLRDVRDGGLDLWHSYDNVEKMIDHVSEDTITLLQDMINSGEYATYIRLVPMEAMLEVNPAVYLMILSRLTSDR